ncbi:MAG: protein phosphatase 2C domain-containing protein [Planctomycetaceae bacterium]|nr:protein phosphatase 2C domain-containing protein [Planctomycetaceae bacterium]
MFFGSLFASKSNPPSSVPTTKADRAWLCLQGVMTEPENHRTRLGEVIQYSHRSPDKESPNEDALGIFTPTDRSLILVVADGVGGRRGGEEASRIVVETFASVLNHFEWEQAARGGVVSSATEAITLRTAILNAIETANQEIMKLGTGAASTIAVVEIQNQTVRTYHVGDSLIMLVGQRGKVKLRTVSHSPVGFAQEAGMLEADEAMHHSERHIVFNVVGSNEMWIEMGSPVEMAPRDTLVISSDGLSDNLHEDEIVELIRKGPLRESIRQLTEVTRERMTQPVEGRPSKPDDTTILAFRRLRKKTGVRKKRKPKIVPASLKEPRVASSESAETLV